MLFGFMLLTWLAFEAKCNSSKEKNKKMRKECIIRAVAGLRSLPESCFANKTKMFFRANIIKKDKSLDCITLTHFPKYDIHPSNIKI